MPVGDSLVNWREDTAHHGQHHFLGMDGVLKHLNRKTKLSACKQERLHASIVLCSWLWTWSDWFWRLALTSPTVMDYHQELQDEINNFSQFLCLRVISTATKAKLTDKFSSGGGDWQRAPVTGGESLGVYYAGPLHVMSFAVCLPQLLPYSPIMLCLTTDLEIRTQVTMDQVAMVHSKTEIKVNLPSFQGFLSGILS